MNENKLIEYFNEMNDSDYKTISEIQESGYGKYEVLDAHLRYEGIIGYTKSILTVFSLIDNL